MYISGVDPIETGGIANKKFTDDLYYSPPEFGIYLKEYSDLSNNLVLNLTQSKILLNYHVTNETFEEGSSARVQSLLNPDNIHELFFNYYQGRYDSIRRRFELTSNDQVDAVHDYLVDQIEYFLA